MGAWGTGNFENDDAADWAADLEEARTIQPVVGALQAASGEGHLEAPECCVALAAAEVVAALQGRPSPAMPKGVASWVGASRLQVNEDLLRLARLAVHRVATQSELLALWQEADEMEGWVATIRELESRLGPA